VRVPGPETAQGLLSGIWVSRYEYESSGRGQTFAGLHYVLVLQHGDKGQVRSLAESAPSDLVMDRTQNGAVLTGTWTGRASPRGYYRGSVYHGAIQLLLGPSGRRRSGKWVGFGRDWEVNVGPWTLTLCHRRHRGPGDRTLPPDTGTRRGRPGTPRAVMSEDQWIKMYMEETS
jgi:hypothetical protein